MNLGSIVKNTIITKNPTKELLVKLGIYTLLGLGGATIFNYFQYHNLVKQGGSGEKIYTKADGAGLFGYTRIEINTKREVEIIRAHVFNCELYLDKNRDGLVDCVYKSGFARTRPRVFERDKHLEQYPQLFQQADRDFRQQIERFKSYINR